MATIVKYILDISTGKSRADVKKAEKSVEGLNKDLKKTEVQGKKSAGSISRLGDSLGKLGLAAAGVGVLALAFRRAASASFDFAKSAVDSVNQLNDIAVKSGISAQGVQAVIQAFEGSGQSAGAAEAFMSRLPQTFAAISTAGTRSSQVAKGLGIALTSAGGAALSSDEIMENLTDKFQSIEDPTKRATAAFLLFGRSAGGFLQAFGATAEFGTFVGFAEQFGVKTGPQASAAAARFQEQLSALSIVSKGTFQVLAQGSGSVSFFSDVLISAGRSLAFVQAFVVEGRAVFAKFGSVISSVVDAVGGLGSILLNVLSPALSVINQALRLGDHLTDGAFSALGMQAKNAAIEFVGLTDAVNAGNLASSQFETQLDKLLSGLDVTGSAASETEAQLAKLMRELQGGETEGAVEAVQDITGAVASLESIISQAEIKTPFDQLEAQLLKSVAAIEQAVDGGADLERGMMALSLVTDDYESAVSAANAELDKLAENDAADKQAAKFSLLESKIAGVGSGISNLLSGDVFGGLSAALPSLVAKIETGIGDRGGDLAGGAGLASLVAPIASAVSGVFGAVSGIGAAGLTDPSVSDEKARGLAVESVEERIRNQARAFAIGMEVLPEILINTLPPLLLDFGKTLIEAFLSLPQLLGQAIVEAFKSIGENRRDRIERRQERRDMTGEERRAGRREKRSERARSVAGGLSTILDAFRMESGGRIPFAESGLRFTGDSTGLAVLHPGEFVVPRTGQAPQNVQRDLGSQSGGGGITINITGTIVEQNAVDELVRRIESRFLAFGGSTSPLFGGA